MTTFYFYPMVRQDLKKQHIGLSIVAPLFGGIVLEGSRVQNNVYKEERYTDEKLESPCLELKLGCAFH